MFARLRNIWRPEVYQGLGRSRRYFEGWYYKIVTRDESEIQAIIPGVSYGADSHCFVQLINGRTSETTYHRYPLDQFKADSNRLDVVIGPNRFRRDQVILNIDGIAQGELTFSGQSLWPVTAFSPGAMGWFSFVPAMECYHGVVSMNHSIDGSLRLQGQATDFTGGLGYIEKDWGRSFPSAWIWMQTNHFAEPGTSLMLSIGRVPWLGFRFTGFTAGLLRRNRLYRFATYTGAAIRTLDVVENRVFIVIEDRRLRLEVRAARSAGGTLRSPRNGSMSGRISESINARVDVRLALREARRPRLADMNETTGSGTARENADVIFDGQGRNAGLEVMGDPAELGAGISSSQSCCRPQV